MTLKNTADRWGPVSQALHWLIVLLIIGQGAVGVTMDDLRSGPDKIQVYALHKSFGLTILGLVTLRLLWRWFAGTPRPVAGTPRWQERIASLSHWGLYALLLAIPLSGWVLNSAAGFPLRWFGLVNLPDIVGQNHDLHEAAEEWHGTMYWFLVILAVIHATAAFYHHLFLRDATLARMLPRGWLKTATHETFITEAPDA
ncbi:MAG: cytochrome b [Pseudomonadota bacterium]|nr:cytochrome b [Pseudomonadota bacterium]